MSNGGSSLSKKIGIWVGIFMAAGGVTAALVVDHHKTGETYVEVRLLKKESNNARVERELIKQSLEYTAQGLKGAAEAIGEINESMKQQSVENAAIRTRQEAIADRLDSAVDEMKDYHR